MWNDKNETPKMKQLKASGDMKAYESYKRAFERSIAYHKANGKSKPASKSPVKTKKIVKSNKIVKPILNAETKKLQKLVSPKKK